MHFFTYNNKIQMLVIILINAYLEFVYLFIFVHVSFLKVMFIIQSLLLSKLNFIFEAIHYFFIEVSRNNL